MAGSHPALAPHHALAMHESLAIAPFARHTWTCPLLTWNETRSCKYSVCLSQLRGATGQAGMVRIASPSGGGGGGGGSGGGTAAAPAVVRPRRRGQVEALGAIMWLTDSEQLAAIAFGQPKPPFATCILVPIEALPFLTTRRLLSAPPLLHTQRQPNSRVPSSGVGAHLLRHPTFVSPRRRAAGRARSTAIERSNAATAEQ